jgi:hypothetical protein
LSVATHPRGISTRSKRGKGRGRGGEAREPTERRGCKRQDAKEQRAEARGKKQEATDKRQKSRDEDARN